MIRALVVVALAASSASAATIHGLVFDDANGDGLPSLGEPGHAGAVVAFGIEQFAVTDASGQFSFTIPDDSAAEIVWVRAPDGYAPGPIWQMWDGTRDIELALHKLPHAVVQPFTFVVAADTHIPAAQTYFGAMRPGICGLPAPRRTFPFDETRRREFFAFQASSFSVERKGSPSRM